MSRTSRARGEAYDNIAIASEISSRERTCPGDNAPAAGALPPDRTTFGNGENIAVGVDYGADENIVVIATNMAVRERVGGA